MKIILRIFLVLSFGIALFNLFKVDWNEPLMEKSAIAVIGVMASTCAFLLVLILMLSQKIARKIKK